MTTEETLRTASHCRHYAMCKIDYLGTGLCPSGPERGFVTFFPQGRMDLYRALATGAVNFTPAALEASDTCSLCGICDKQCFFATGLRPLAVMRGLKELAERFRAQGAGPTDVPEDDFLARLRDIAGVRYATNDPGILVTYSHDPCPLAGPRMPRYAVVPGSESEVSSIVRLCSQRAMPYAVRGNGSSVMGFVMSDGLVIDLVRMKSIEIDRANWCARVGPGVSAFELQQKVLPEGFRVNAAEPAALVCANIMCSGIFSTFSASYGTNADNIVTARFVGRDGGSFSLHDPGAPNLYGYRKEDAALPGICVSASVRLHPVTPDEEGLLVPFPSLAEAVAFARELSIRRIGLAVGVLGGEYVSTFLSPDAGLSRRVKEVFTEDLGIAYLVLVIGDRYAVGAVRSMGLAVIDQELFRTLFLGLPTLAGSDWTGLVRELSGPERPYGFLTKDALRPLIEAALRPSAEMLASAFPEDLRPFFASLYRDPRMTDLVWLNMFRILSSRMGREKHVVAFIVYLPAEPALVDEVNRSFRDIGEAHGIKHDFGFLTPLDLGKRAVFEYDFYLDHTDPAASAAMRRAAAAAAAMIERHSAAHPGLKWIRYTLYQGFARKEHILYID